MWGSNPLKYRTLFSTIIVDMSCFFCKLDQIGDKNHSFSLDDLTKIFGIWYCKAIGMAKQKLVPSLACKPKFQQAGIYYLV